MANDDRIMAIATARRWRDILVPKFAGPIEFIRNLDASEEVESGGWSITVARFHNPSVYIEVWFDEFPNIGRRCFWYGFRGTAKAVAEILSRYNGRIDRVFSELSERKNGKLRIGLPVRRSFVVYEKFSEHDHFLGIYNTREIRGGHLDIPTGFVIKSLIPFGLFEIDNNDYVGVENRLDRCLALAARARPSLGGAVQNAR
jgi:hypothetical protein